MIVRTKLSELQDELASLFEKVILKGQGPSSFLHVVDKGRAVEFSEDGGGFWLEFWEKSEDEDAAPVKEMTLASSEQAMRETRAWLS